MAGVGVAIVAVVNSGGVFNISSALHTITLKNEELKREKVT